MMMYLARRLIGLVPVLAVAVVLTFAANQALPGDPITVDAMYARYRDFLKPNDHVVIENGTSMTGIAALPLPEGAQVHSQSLWGSIGWATGATLGVALADRSGEPCCSPGKVPTS